MMPFLFDLHSLYQVRAMAEEFDGDNTLRDPLILWPSNRQSKFYTLRIDDRTNSSILYLRSCKLCITRKVCTVQGAVSTAQSW